MGRRQPEEVGDVQGDRDADRRRRQAGAAAASADAAESQARSDLGETLLRTAFPKVGEWADKQEADQRAREAARDEQERAEIAALPLATVQLTATATSPPAGGRATAPGVEGARAGGAGSRLPVPGPLLDAARVSVDLSPRTTPRRARRPRHDALGVPDPRLPPATGPTTSPPSRGSASRGRPHLRGVGHGLRERRGLLGYFYADAGQSTVTVTDGGTRLSVSIAMSGAWEA